MIRPPTQIPGGAGGTITSDDVGGIALVVLTETLRQMGPEAMKATGEGIYWQSSRMDAQEWDGGPPLAESERMPTDS